MEKICVYTCITGNYDNLKEIKNIEKGIDYYCFTNNKNIRSNTWNVVQIKNNNLSDLVLSRKIKILGHPLINQKYDILVWMDASVEFKKNIKDFVNTFFSYKDLLAGFKHGSRISILEEMDACIRFRKEKIENINKLKEFYQKENYNYDNGLMECTVFIKRPLDKKVIETMKLWYKMFVEYAKRDQLSFNYCIYKTGLKIKWINEKVFDNKWFKWHEHSINKMNDKYMIYYGDINKYNYKYQFENAYKIKNNDFIIKEKIKFNTNRIYIELSNNLFVKYTIKKINVKCYDIEYHNTLVYDDKNIFFKKPGFIILKGDFKTNDNLKIILEFEYIREYEKNEIIEFLVGQKVELEKNNDSCQKKIMMLEKENIDLKKNYYKILNSKTWKFTEPFRFLSKKILRK